MHKPQYVGSLYVFLFRYDERYQLTAPSGDLVVLVVQASSGGCDDRLEAYEGSMYLIIRIMLFCKGT